MLLKMSIKAFEEYMQSKNDSLFSEMILPSAVDRDTLIDNILLKSIDFSPIESNPEWFKKHVYVFFKKNFRSFESWATALDITYNPIENYDRFEDSTDTNKYNRNGTDNTTTELFTTTYETNNYNATDKTNTTSENSDVTDGTNNHVSHVHGNIGVTTNQQMIQSEIMLRYNNLIDMITDLFISEFCVMIY